MLIQIDGEEQKTVRFDASLGFEVTVRLIFSTVWEQNAKHKFACCVFRTFVNQQFIVSLHKILKWNVLNL